MRTPFPAPTPSTIPIANRDEVYPVHRIYAIGRNYADHAKEMGMNPEKGTPLFFTKPATALVETGATIPYPKATEDLHHEVELVAALGPCPDQFTLDNAQGAIYGYAVGIDLTRRDIQWEAKKAGLPWDQAKGFDRSAPITSIHTAENVGHPTQGRIWMDVNGEPRQEGNITQMMWTIPEIIVELDKLYDLRAGDLIFTGTPVGVGPLLPGDAVTGGVEGVDTIALTIAP